MSAKGAPKPPRWTPAEDRVIEAHYPAGGVSACEALLPHRSAYAIYNRARRLDVAAPADREVLQFGSAATYQKYAPKGVDQVLRAWSARRYGSPA